MMYMYMYARHTGVYVYIYTLICIISSRLIVIRITYAHVSAAREDRRHGERQEDRRDSRSGKITIDYGMIYIRCMTYCIYYWVYL